MNPEEQLKKLNGLKGHLDLLKKKAEDELKKIQNVQHNHVILNGFSADASINENGVITIQFDPMYNKNEAFVYFNEFTDKNK